MDADIDPKWLTMQIATIEDRLKWLEEEKVSCKGSVDYLNNLLQEENLFSQKIELLRLLQRTEERRRLLARIIDITTSDAYVKSSDSASRLGLKSLAKTVSEAAPSMEALADLSKIIDSQEEYFNNADYFGFACGPDA